MPRHVLTRHQAYHASTECATSTSQDDGLYCRVLAQACEGLREVNHHGASQRIQRRRAVYCDGHDTRFNLGDAYKGITAA